MIQENDVDIDGFIADTQETERNEKHPKNAKPPILVTLWGITNDFIFRHCPKANVPITFTPEGIETFTFPGGHKINVSKALS